MSELSVVPDTLAPKMEVTVSVEQDERGWAWEYNWSRGGGFGFAATHGVAITEVLDAARKQLEDV